MVIEKLTDKSSKHFQVICDWQRNWWGAEYKEGKVEEFMSRCLYENRIPQTYIALDSNEVVGMYQIDMYDGVDVRPDYYPWLVNVYVDDKKRGNGICANLMEHAKQSFISLGLKRVYLYTDHINLYEKYGWIYLEEVVTFEGKNRRIYYIDL